MNEKLVYKKLISHFEKRTEKFIVDAIISSLKYSVSHIFGPISCYYLQEQRSGIKIYGIVFIKPETINNFFI